MIECNNKRNSKPLIMYKSNSRNSSKFKGCSQLKLMPEFSFTTEKYYTETGMIYGAGKDTDAKRQEKII